MVSYKFQTLGHNSFESPENLHSNRRRESKAHVIESIFNSIIEDNKQFQPNQGQGCMISNEMHNMGNPLSTSILKYVATTKIVTFYLYSMHYVYYNINSQDSYAPLTR